MFIDRTHDRKNEITQISLKEHWYIKRSHWLNQTKLSLQAYRDMDDDASLYVFISTKKPLNNKGYIPSQLVAIDSPYIIQHNPGMQLRPEANAAFHDLAKAFYDTFDKKLYLVSAYRSHKLQQQLLDDGCPRSRCARPGTSEHQLWLAIDIHVGYNGRQTNSMANKDSIYYRRLEQNAHRFGRHNTFQKWIHIDWQMEEWRHWRYLGIQLATYLREHNMSLAEYYQQYRIQVQ
jgi:zinc D-Ala-D-Ala carboxypeptidase